MSTRPGNKENAAPRSAKATGAPSNASAEASKVATKAQPASAASASDARRKQLEEWRKSKEEERKSKSAPISSKPMVTKPDAKVAATRAAKPAAKNALPQQDKKEIPEKRPVAKKPALSVKPTAIPANWAGVLRGEST
eukprot:Colp12_sorted_trinity150504_noHs@32547